MNVTRRNRATRTHRSEERLTATLTPPPARRQRQSRLPAGGTGGYTVYGGVMGRFAGNPDKPPPLPPRLLSHPCRPVSRAGAGSLTARWIYCDSYGIGRASISPPVCAG